MLVILYAAVLGTVTALLWSGVSFYSAPLAARPHHESYWSLKPGGSLGHPLGVAGSTALVLLLLYSVRKRVRALQRLGALRRWLDVHIFLGVTGPLIVVLHSSFKVQGLVALSFWSMVAVALSGVFGRYLYQQIPRTRAGDEMTLAQLVELDRALAARLRDDFGLAESHLRVLDRLTQPPEGRGLLRSLVGAVAADLALGRRLRAFAATCGAVPPAAVGQLLRVARQKALVHRRLALWDALHRLFHHWHVIHKPFALVMYLFMAVHIVVASMTGYAWGR